MAFMHAEINTIMATAEINTKQGLTRVPTYAELMKELDKEKIKTNEIRKVFDRNAWYFHDSPLNTAPNENSNIHPAELQADGSRGDHSRRHSISSNGGG